VNEEGSWLEPRPVSPMIKYSASASRKADNISTASPHAIML
jgi:hypothetical protein